MVSYLLLKLDGSARAQCLLSISVFSARLLVKMNVFSKRATPLSGLMTKKH
ncbi:rCG44731, isoform CRA_b [Rattus norvegicus]|uniref:RCG44731, isoform CRA_b n=1 Tax=Rattus norvegicus TaxID=10116 RepID=A6I531_RAT|nr:rCG44731, isoform CRA_b [Rattus norvegicus]